MTTTPCLNSLSLDLARIKNSKPLIHNITNLVVMPITANILLALGASPVMAHAKEEIDAILQLAHALNLNIGTLDAQWVAALTQGQTAALKKGIPIVFDPVGAGASAYRTQIARQILSTGVSLVKGNASEIMALVNDNIKTKGVDSTQNSHVALSAAKQLSQMYRCIVVVSGPTDWVVNQEHSIALNYGTPWLTQVVGMGCSLTAVLAAFLAINPDSFLAAQHAVCLFGLAAELAAEKATGPGSFYTAFIDCLYQFHPEQIKQSLQTFNEPACQ